MRLRQRAPCVRSFIVGRARLPRTTTLTRKVRATARVPPVSRKSGAEFDCRNRARDRDDRPCPRGSCRDRPHGASEIDRHRGSAARAAEGLGGVLRCLTTDQADPTFPTMRAFGIAIIVLAVALFGMGRATIVVSGHADPSIAASMHHHASHAHAHDEAAGYADHADTTDHDGDPSCASVCCTLACHAVTMPVGGTVSSPVFNSMRPSPEDAAVLHGDAPPGLDRPPRNA